LERIIFPFPLNKKLKVALTYNIKPEEKDPSLLNSTKVNKDELDDMFAEWDTWETINALRDALALYNEVVLIEADNNAFENLKREKPDIVFNVAEGLLGTSREAQIPAMLDFLNIPYTGSDPWTLTTCLNKGRAKEVLTHYNIPNPKFKVIKKVEDFIPSEFNFPIFIKPISEGSSKGIYNRSLVTSPEQVNGTIENMLSQYKQDLLVEEYLPGKEFTVAILGNNTEAEVLPIIEMDFTALPEGVNPFYSYEAKWILDAPNNPLDIYICPANIEQQLTEKIEETALRTYHALDCKDWSRIDMRLDSSGIPNIIEINPLPGVLPDPRNNSSYPKAARARGLSYDEVINSVLAAALKRHKLI